MYRRVFFTFFSIVVAIIFSTISVFSSCSLQPSYFEVTSNNNELGTFAQQESVFINANIEQAPLSITAVYTGDEPSCFTQASDVKFKLTSTAPAQEAQNLEEIQVNVTTYEYRFTKTYQEEGLILSENSYYQLQYSLQGETFRNSLIFRADSSKPQISITNFENRTYSPGDVVEFTYEIQDERSGLSSAFLGTTPLNITNSRSPIVGSYSEVVEESKSILLRATDNTGLSANKRVIIKVDDEGPEFSNFKNLGYSYNGIQRTLSFSIQIEDESLEEFDLASRVQTQVSKSGVFAQLQGPTSCREIEDQVFECVWEDVVITAANSQDVDITFLVDDIRGNMGQTSESLSLFIDRSEPEVTTFKVENSKTSRDNIISGFTDADFEILLRVEDESLDQGPRVYSNFDILSDQGVDDYIYCGVGCFKWDISDVTQLYQTDTREKVNFSVTVADLYGNQVTQVQSIIIDNAKPQVFNSSYLENSQVKDGVIKSGEQIDIGVEFFEPHFEEETIYGNFVAITGDSSENNEQARCREIEEDTYRCFFEDVKVGSGPFIRNATIVIEDDAGNRAIENLPIEVLQLRDGDIPTSFTIDDMAILNPLNRNVMTAIGEGGVETAWFEGEITSLDSSYSIVNYELRSCNESFVGGFLSLKTNSPSLYPYVTKTQLNSENISEFVLKVELSGHSNPQDLQEMQLQCEMFILFRDDTTLYEPGIPVNFTLNFSFYDMPRETLLRAHALDLKEKIEDSQMLGDTFTTVFDAYNMLSTVCNTLSTVGSTYGALKQGLDIVSNSFKAGTFTYPIGKAMDEGLTPLQGALSEIGFAPGGITERFCSYLACDYGTLPATTDILESMNSVVGNQICSALPSDSAGGSQE